MNYTHKTLGAAAVVALFSMGSCGSKETVGKNPQSSMDSFSYSIGINIGQRIKEQGLKQVSYESFVKGVQDGMRLDSGYAMTDDQMGQVYSSYIAKVQKDLSKKLQEETKEKLQAVSKEENVSVLPSKAYYRLLKEGNGLSPRLFDTSRCQVFTLTNTRELSSNRYSVFPNPSTGYFAIRVPSKSKDIEIQLRASNGQILHQEIFLNVNKMVKLDKQLSAGIYWLKIRDNEGSEILKLEIQP